MLLARLLYRRVPIVLDHLIGAADTARDRRGFASGALLAAEWIEGRTGWYSMQDVLRRQEPVS